MASTGVRRRRERVHAHVCVFASSLVAFASDDSEMNTCVHQRKHGGCPGICRKTERDSEEMMKIKLFRLSLAG
ncbi:hypothetical protein QQF64_035547 [Cirrhinus molitorella]|uniref:Secreted protein n=1 Tax=Cirrhinus molitorella TaxID=172907 RepID=A0ABR3NG40_9TELE